MAAFDVVRHGWCFHHEASWSWQATQIMSQQGCWPLTVGPLG